MRARTARRESSAPPLPPEGSAAHHAGGFRLLLGFAGFAALLFALTRLALLLRSGAAGAHGAGTVALALAAGELHDLVVIAWLALPLAVLLALLPARALERRRYAAPLWAAIAVALYGLLFSAAAEWFFFAELGGRFNFVAVDYLLYPHEVLTNIWESYPTGRILAGLALPTFAALRSMRAAVRGGELESRPRRAALALALGGFAAGATWFASPGWGEVSDDRVLNEIARNGLYTFCAAARGSHASYDGLYAELPTSEVFARLERLRRPPASALDAVDGGGVRTAAHGTARPRNVVVVLEESLGSEFVGALRRGPERSLTPQLDALARSGTLLTHAYSTGNRTIRAIEATTTGLPPLPGVSLVRRPQSKDLVTLPALLAENGWSTLFVYGGRALFDGMGSYLRSNGIERVIEQGDFPEGTFTTAWGVADEAIFARALTEIDALAATRRPFYTLVLSVSNHRPFLFPEDHVRSDPARKGRENAVRYADWALGEFMANAADRSWFDDTLFVLMGDHGARVYGSSSIPLASYEVPILFIGPGIPAGARLDTLASSLDVPPTVLGRLGLAEEPRFFGRDLFSAAPHEARAFMTHNSDIALLEGNRMAVLGLRGATHTFDCDLAAATCADLAATTQDSRELIDDAIAFYRGADLLYRNGGLRLAAGNGGGSRAPAAGIGAARAGG